MRSHYNLNKKYHIAKNSDKCMENNKKAEEIYRHIIEKIHEKRIQVGFSGEDIEVLTGISQSSFSRIESGAIYLKTIDLIVLILALDIDIEEILPYETASQAEKRFNYYIRGISDEKVDFMLNFIREWAKRERGEMKKKPKELQGQIQMEDFFKEIKNREDI